MRFTGHVIVEFKKSVLEPQGKAIELSLKERGVPVEQVRVGKYIEISIEAESAAQAREKIQEISEAGLYNPVMEVCRIELQDEAGE